MKISIVFLLFCMAPSAYGQTYFYPDHAAYPVNATNLNSMDVEAADVDGDGDLDLVIAAEYQRNLLFFNDGTGQFSEDPSRLFPEKNTGDGFMGEDSEDIAFADFDQDGDLDVLFVSEDTVYHELLVNDGTGSFTFIVYEFPSSTANAVAVLDLNNDDYPDIIIGNNGQNQVYLNNQDLTFSEAPARWPVNVEGTQDLKLVDLDGDGDMDIIEGIDLGTNNVLINTNGFFTEENNRLPSHPFVVETRKVTLADVNGDGFKDVFLSTVNFVGNANNQNRLYLNDGNGFFMDASDTHLPIYDRFTLDAVFVDYDADGDLDLITTDFQNPDGNHHSFANDGTGHFTESTLEVFSTFAFTKGVSLYLGLLNDDAYPDLYFGNFQESDDLLFYDPEALGFSKLSNGRYGVGPNPFENQIEVSLSRALPNVEELLFQLYGVDGSLLVQQEISPSGGIIVLPVSLMEGVYAYRLSGSWGFQQSGLLLRR
ncbi:MAG TPA: VCBS repeat-containing protein [Flavobacteriaceae bacterium]|nr:VCBS repeat-containing protein [Flavobacteriaceae bacterium]MCB9213193.1 VCBS repeat-containing protein [Alteromonas sp.]HPF10135.1 VCBS repeat-containing protein [Flavobacteriaceae bacterium]HQU22577.1 VCBS repeat-containing protein [Flavobacteriaceae bacterium]HQU65772.1 VCBS repeat-containing protein [Flavobacteriaceae bacterium]